MPVYNGGSIIKDTLLSILEQDFVDFELVITDDNSTDNTPEIIRAIKDNRIKFYGYQDNVGYPKNLERCRIKCSNEILFLMGQDDILAQGTLRKVYDIFSQNQSVGAIARPYYWFHEDIAKPVRSKDQLSHNQDSAVSVNSDLKSIVTVFQSLDQLSGLAFRCQFMDLGFHTDIFTAHIYPFISIFKNHNVVYLKDYVVAVRIGTSQTRHISSIYAKSPLQSWVDLFNTVLHEERFDEIREYCIKNFVAKNFVGLIQIKTNGRMSWLLREIRLLIKYNRRNIVDPRFWFFSVSTIILPSFILRRVVDFYKENFLSKSLKNVQPIVMQLRGSKY